MITVKTAEELTRRWVLGPDTVTQWVCEETTDTLGVWYKILGDGSFWQKFQLVRRRQHTEPLFLSFREATCGKLSFFGYGG
jgi:hypothetical protein